MRRSSPGHAPVPAAVRHAGSMSAAGDAGPGRRAGARTVSVRLRILSAVLVTTALGMLGAGTVSYLLARHATFDGVAKALSQENEEIDTISALAADGDAGRAIRGPSDVLFVAIKRSVPDPGEAIMGLVDGEVAWVPSSNDAFQLSLAADPELVAAAAGARPDEPVTVREISTRAHPRMAYISVPIQVKGSPALGHYVAAVDVRAALGPVNRTHLTYGVVCLLALGVVALVGYQVAGRLLSPLRALRRTAQRISDTDLGDRIPAELLSSRDEVADLGHTVNAMLDRLSASFDTQRRMLDDAGHELRTPITIVRGHLELVDPGDPEDVRRTRDLAIDELDRMQRLVDELMVLAKARRPDFVRLAPTGVADLLFSVFDKVTTLGERRWTLDGAPEETVWLDPQRVTQALVQLAANAVKFTGPGAVIALGGRIRGSDLLLEVSDEGVGIEPGEQAAVFERFGRGSQRPSGPDPGAGLGLAIVTAIAEAHHGSVELESAPGRGSTFTLVLPRQPGTAAGTPPTSSTKEPAWQPS
jgi:two-component system OmpR family sensor kinase